ncbi:anthranilate phosphoribosyltransferase [Gloeomargarita lithophora Alchichica-D10]|uniref:Anthranilate phosphoribosyltransferase n=1 Tax=Gloeomargarita lithophora Alchichica-D10 TaxID=1188229 RepID=A0A1J0ACA7_9CYAN|nr:anthranilate phosphoribosyltransferase [Gloeomargarita lithophora]APB33563.1 anthranilate phosphoribosyltransferase [Gloeomargarita lithophora Alchichica-D10]
MAMVTALLQQLLNREPLTPTQAEALMQAWLGEELPPALAGGILVALQAKGVTAAELAAMAQVVQNQAVLPNTADLPPCLDTCGTGGDGAGTFNISTAVAFVAAAAGVAVAKHGNRSASSRVGSADVLEALGLRLHTGAEQAVAALQQVGITFLFAPGWHPAMKAVAPLRQTLKIRSVFNLIGPLVNPLQPQYQMLGVYRAELLPVMAETLHILGRKRAVVLHGREGLDEAGLGDCTDIILVGNERQTLDPQALGLTPAPLAALAGGDVAANAAILQNVLQGRGSRAQQDVVALNSGLALWTAERVNTIGAGVTIAQDILTSGCAWDKLHALVQLSQT